MDHATLQDLLPAYALGSLDEAEAREVETHVPGCETCRAELSSLESAAAALVHVARPVEPPPVVRSRLLATIERASRPLETAQPGAPRPEATPRIHSLPPREGPGIAVIAAGFAIAAIFGGLVWSHTLLERRLDDRREHIARLEADLQRSRAELRQTRKRLQNSERELLRFAEVSRFLSSLEVRSVHIAGTENAPGAEAKLAFDRQTGRVLLFAKELPEVPPDKAYQLWFFHEGKPLPGGTFQTARPGLVALDDRIPAEARGTPVFAVTLEPAGGVPEPTGSVVLGPGPR